MIKRIVYSCIASVALVGCGANEDVLPGDRTPLFADQAPVFKDEITAFQASKPVNVTDIVLTRNRAVNHSPHARISENLQPLFTTNIGVGNSLRAKIVSDPVVADGRIFVADAGAGLTAVDTQSGDVLWRIELRPDFEDTIITGGGMAVSGENLFITTGYGELLTVDTVTGEIMRRHKLNAADAGTPTVIDSVVYLVDSNHRAWAIDAKTGKNMWNFKVSGPTGRLEKISSVAVSDDYAVFAFSSGQVIATFAKGGEQRWTEVIKGNRSGRAQAQIPQVAADPVIVGRTVYLGNASGRFSALDLKTGRVNWSLEQGALNPAKIDGNSVFIVNDFNMLMRLDRATGDVIWQSELPDLIPSIWPLFKPETAVVHYGPLLASNELIVASSDARLRFFNPNDGILIRELTLKEGAAAQPVIIDDTLFVLMQNGELAAFR